MKVLIASDLYTPQVNGVVTSVLNLQRELEAHGHEVRILTLKQAGNLDYGDCVYSIPSISGEFLYPGVRIMRSLGLEQQREIEDWGPDIIHTQNEFSTYLLANAMATKLNLPMVHTYHTVYEDYVHYFSYSASLGRNVVRKFMKNRLNIVDSIIVPTDKVRTQLLGYGVIKPIYTVPTGINLEAFMAPRDAGRLESLRQGLGLKAEDFHLIYLGRLAKEKNVEEIIGYLKNLPDRYKLIIVGGGPYQAVLEDFVRARGLTQRVIFTGMVKPDEVPYYYSLGDVFVSASTSETQGLTYVEALACGLPALCRKDGALEKVLFDGENGWQYESEGDFGQYLKELSSDPDLVRRMGEASRRIAEGFSSKRFYEEVMAVYQETLNRPRQPRMPLPTRIRHKLVNWDFDYEFLPRFKGRNNPQE